MVYLLTLCNVLNHGAYMASRLTATLYALDLGASQFEVGLLVGLYAFFSVILAIYAGQLSDRIGPHRPMIAGCLASFVALLLPWLAPGLAALYLSAALIGAAFIFFNVSIQSLVGLMSDGTNRSRNFATLSQGYSISSVAAPLAGGYLIDHVGPTQTYLVLSITALLAALLLARAGSLAAVRSPRHEDTSRGSFVDLLRNRSMRASFISSGLVVTGWDLYSFYFPVYGYQLGFSAATIGTVLAVFGVAAFVVRMVLPALIRRHGEARLLSTCAFIAAVLLASFPAFDGVWALGALSFLLGLVLGCGQPLSMMICYARAPQGRSGEANGIRLTVNHVAHCVVPIAAGALGSIFGIVPVFLANGACLVVAGWVIRR